MSNTPLPAQLNEEPRSDDGLRRSTHLYLAVGMALLIGLLVASYMQASAGLDALKEFGLMNQRADHLDRLSQLLVEAQSSVRGYALTREPAYFNAYKSVRPKIHDTLEIIKRDEQDGAQAGSVEQLIKRAENLAARMELTARHVEGGIALDTNWFAQDSLAMDAYRQQQATMKVALLTRNLQNVKQSTNGFENARLSAIVLAGASLLLLMLVVSQQQKKQDLREKIHRMLAQENERLEYEVRSRTEELTNLATYLTTVRETEKLDLAREMHDELGALLTAAKLDADWIERKLPADAQALVAQRLVRLRQSLASGITLKRRITNNLRPALLYDLGLIEALKALIEEFRQGEEKIDVVVALPESEPELSEDVSLSLFRIVQEAFTNIRKYAQARHVRVSLHVTAETIELEVEDDGVGFDPASPKLARHGLAGIKHRVFTHGGQLDIRSAPDAGVTIRVTLPA
ncbi:ATP-binding protein [Thiobacillus sp.]|uniref:ATP-binding protein n=1 Tax=Thiobacillus sp. TaxID=924 RepID=UPI0025DB3F6B|nr:ATP-binding protein [Thiobacillus sp.]